MHNCIYTQHKTNRWTCSIMVCVVAQQQNGRVMIDLQLVEEELLYYKTQICSGAKGGGEGGACKKDPCRK